MPHIVGESCIKCKHTNCVSVCPVDCFHEGVNFVVIDPEVCIDCALCVHECPVHAIYESEDLPDDWLEYIELNETLSKEWPKITKPKDALPTAAEFKDIYQKRQLLDLSPFKSTE